MCSIQLFNDEEMNTTSTDKVFEYTVRVYHDGKFIQSIDEKFFQIPWQP